MSGDRRKARLASFIREVWDEGRLEAIGDYLAPTYTLFHDPGDPWDGRTLDVAGFTERVRLSRAPFPDQRFDVQGLFAEGDTVVLIWFWTATHLGDFPGFPATGQTLRMSGATAYRLDDDDRLLGHWQVADRLSVFRQLQAHRSAGAAAPA